MSVSCCGSHVVDFQTNHHQKVTISITKGDVWRQVNEIRVGVVNHDILTTGLQKFRELSDASAMGLSQLGWIEAIYSINDEVLIGATHWSTWAILGGPCALTRTRDAHEDCYSLHVYGYI